MNNIDYSTHSRLPHVSFIPSCRCNESALVKKPTSPQRVASHARPRDREVESAESSTLGYVGRLPVRSETFKLLVIGIIKATALSKLVHGEVIAPMAIISRA
jgi:hypothetical protein